MEIQPILNSIAQHAHIACHSIQHTALWMGCKIQSGYMNHLVPAVKSLWSHTASLLTKLFQLIKQGHGSSFAIAGGLFIAGIAAFKIADHYAYEEDLVSKAAWKTLGVAAFVCATVVTSATIASLVI